MGQIIILAEVSIRDLLIEHQRVEDVFDGLSLCNIIAVKHIRFIIIGTVGQLDAAVQEDFELLSKL